MIVIGIDPGIERTGVGIVEYKDNNYTLLFSELIKTSPELEKSKRLLLIYNRLQEIIKDYSIDCASVEKLFFAKNVKTALIVSEARGVIYLTLEMFNIPSFEYTPLQVKHSLIGYGRGTKDQIKELVKIILKLKEPPKSDDIADGIALGITHINTQRSFSKMKLSQ